MKQIQHELEQVHTFNGLIAISITEHTVIYLNNIDANDLQIAINNYLKEGDNFKAVQYNTIKD